MQKKNVTFSIWGKKKLQTNFFSKFFNFFKFFLMGDSNDLIKIYPNPIIISDLEPNETDSIDFSTTNYSKKPIRIRFSLPFNSPFQLNSTTDFTISPGLQIPRTITYTAKDKVEKTELTISSPSFKTFTIPVIFYPPSSSVEISRKHFDLGEISIGFTSTETFKITNYGTRDGNYTISSKQPNVEIIPNSGILKTNQIETIQFQYTPDKAGKVEFDIEVKVDSYAKNLQLIHVKGDVQDHTLQIFYNNEEKHTITFGRTFFGQKMKKTIKMVNHAPVKRAFVIQVPKDPGETMLTSKPVFTTSPMEGEIEANSTKEIAVYYQPPLQKLEEDTEVFYRHVTKVDVLKTPISIPLHFEGSAVQAQFSVSCLDFYYGDVIVDSTTTKEMVIENHSQYKDLSFQIKEIAHFHFKPLSGIIKIGEKQTVLVTFDPKSLGQHEASTTIEFCGGILKRPIVLTGNAKTGTIDEARKRLPFWETDPKIAYSLKHPATKYGLTSEEIKKKQVQQEIFEEFISAAAQKRKEKILRVKLRSQAETDAKHLLQSTKGYFSQEELEKETLKRLDELVKGTDDNVNLGFEQAEGLIEPEPPAEQILSARAPRKNLAKQLQQEKAKKAKQGTFKTKPTTNAEIAECAKQLSPSQQLAVFMDKEKIDFGVVPVTARKTQKVSFTNNLTQHVFVQFKLDEFPEFKFTKPSSQVVPPMSVASFDIVLCSDEQKPFSKMLKYTINNAHEGGITCIGKVVPIELKLSKPGVEFDFTQSNMQPLMKDYVTIQNPTDAIANVQWKGLDDVFHISPTKGTIQPHEQMSCEVIYRPGTVSHSELLAVLEVKGGPDLPFSIKGSTGCPKINLSSAVVDFDLVPLGISYTQEIVMKNTGGDPAIYFLAPSSTEDITITPSSGKLMPNDKVTFKINLKCTKTKEISQDIEVLICGQETQKFHISGHAENPHVELQFGSLDFGKIFIGNQESKQISIKNVGHIPAIVTLDLSSYEQFSLEYDANLNTQANDGKQSSIQNTTTSTFNNSNFSAPDTASTTFRPRGSIYKITIAAESEITCDLLFKPSSVGDFTFELPLQIADNTFITSTVQPMVMAEAIQPPLSVSTTAIDFGLTPIYDPLNPNIRPNMKRFMLKNKSKRNVDFRIDTSAIEDHFVIEPTQGTLEPNTEIPIISTFKPTSSDPFMCYIAVYATPENQDEILTSRILFMGTGFTRAFCTEVETIALPIVPLNVKAERTIKLINTRFVDSKIEIVLPVSEKNFPLTVTLPDGPNFQHSVPSIPMTVSFQSDKPLSFSTVIAITDSLGNSHSITVSACTDNSVFTLYPTLSNTKFNISSVIGRPITGSTKSIIPDDFICAFSNKQGLYTELDKLRSYSVNQTQIEFTKSFLNAFVLSSKLTDFSEDLSNSEGDLIYEMINNLAGSKKPSYKSDNSSKYNKLKSLLNNLIGWGAHVSHIKPEYLMSKEEYMKFYQKKIIRQMLGFNYYGAPEVSTIDQKALSKYSSTKTFAEKFADKMKLLEKLFKLISQESWLFVVNQVLKLFLFSKVDADKMNSIPGFADTMKNLKANAKDSIFNDVNRNPKTLNNSNIMSQQEGAVLKWVSAYYCTNNLSNQNLVPLHTFNDLKNPSALASCFLSLIPNSTYEETSSNEENANNLIQLINNLKLNFIPSVDEILTGNEPIQALLAFQLFNTLPHYVPTAVIEFETELNSSTTQALTLTNPSKTELTYNAQLTGSSNFSFEGRKFVLQPNETLNIQITYFARSHNSDTARITLVPSRPTQSNEPIVASTIVVTLVSNVTISQPSKKFTMEGPIYSQTQFDLPITNEAKKAGTFKVYTQYSYITDDNVQVKMDSLTEFVNYHRSKTEIISDDQPFEAKIVSHCPFIVESNNIQLEADTKEKPLSIIFNPIAVGKYKLQVLVTNPSSGEFVYELNAKASIHQEIDASELAKTECNVRQSLSLQVDPSNKFLAQALAYSFIKLQAQRDSEQLSETKFHEMLNSLSRDYQLQLSKREEVKYKVNYTSQFFNGPNSYTLTNPEPQPLQITFIPTKPGTYPCRVILTSTYDTKIIKITGTAIAQTRDINIDFTTNACKTISQEIPFSNPSMEMWNFKIVLTGDSGFDVPARLTLKPKSTAPLTISFRSRKMGIYQATLQVTNLNKESVINYHLTATVQEPLAEEKIVLKCQARHHLKKSINLPSNFIQNGRAKITSDVPVINFNNSIAFSNGQPIEPLVIDVFALRSGVAAGTITVLDEVANVFIWYILEIEVLRPDPEEVINVSTIERQPVQITFPVFNPKQYDVKFDITFSDSDITGPSKIVIPPNSNYTYECNFLPLFTCTRTSYVMFFNDEEGEYNYLMNIQVDPALPQVLAPFTASVGNYSTTTIKVDNMTSKTASFRWEIENPNVFHINMKPLFSIPAKQSKNIEVKYTPTKVGTKEVSKITFRSKDAGTFVYSVSGIGKPPQSLSPQIVEAAVGRTQSSSIVFTNPFSFPCLFEVTLLDEEGKHFKLLSKKRAYQFTEYGETQQISFTFTSQILGQFNGSILITTTGSDDKITWNYPIIGVAISGAEATTPEIHGRSGQEISKSFELPLVGESASYQPNNYVLSFEFPNGFEWINNYITIRTLSAKKEKFTTTLKVQVDFTPKRPIDAVLHISAENPAKQKWRFPLKLHIEPSMATSKIVLESTLNKLQTAKVVVDDAILEPAEFHAYFMQGSATELSLSKSDGIIEPTQTDTTEMPFQIMFLPKTYGKLVRGTLIIDTEEAEYVFDVYGKMPDYLPPQIKKACIDTSMPESARLRDAQTLKKRNVIKDNIGKAKITKPRTSRRPKRLFE